MNHLKLSLVPVVSPEKHRLELKRLHIPPAVLRNLPQFVIFESFLQPVSIRGTDRPLRSVASYYEIAGVEEEKMREGALEVYAAVCVLRKRG